MLMGECSRRGRLLGLLPGDAMDGPHLLSSSALMSLEIFFQMRIGDEEAPAWVNSRANSLVYSVSRVCLYVRCEGNECVVDYLAEMGRRPESFMCSMTLCAFVAVSDAWISLKPG